MRNMSFQLTTAQILDGRKTVTRRIGWSSPCAGAALCAVEKGMGLAKGETVRRLAVIRVTDVRRERLFEITPNDVVREGFRMTTEDFIRMFCETQRCYPSTFVTRIEFEIERYLDGRGQLNLFESKGTT